jgi:serine phosphatase RsbU (regulator of sigma subunit)
MEQAKQYLLQYKDLHQPQIQFVLLNTEGHVVASDDAIVSLKDYQTRSVFGALSFFEHLAPIIQALQPQDQPIVFPRLEISILGTEGVFDFIFEAFSPQEGVPPLLAWRIERSQYHNQYLYKVQQERNESLIGNDQVQQERKRVKKLQAAFEQIQTQYQRVQSRRSHSSRYLYELQQFLFTQQIQGVRAFFQDCGAVLSPKDEVSADFVWFYPQGRHICVVFGDMSGIEAEALYQTMVIQRTLGDLINSHTPNDCEGLLSALIASETLKQADIALDRFFKVAVLSLDLQTQVLRYAAIKQDALFVQADGAVHQLSPTHNHQGQLLEQAVSLQYQSGAQIYLLSDGYSQQIGESSNTKWGEKRIQQLLQPSAASLQTQAQAFQKAFDEWRGSYPQTDDATFLALKLA